MLHRGIKFVHAAVLVTSAMMAFLFVRGLDEQVVLGSSAQVWVFDSDDSVSGARVAREIVAFSADHHVSVAREVPDAKNPDGLRHLYLTSGDPRSDAASWLDGGYPAFSRHVDTDVHPIAEVGQRDPRGFYYVFGTPEAADALVARFGELGLRASVQRPLSADELAVLFAGDDLFWSLWVVALAAATMTGASVLLSAKAYGVLRLQGKSLRDILVRDLGQLAGAWVIAAGAVAGVALVFLGLYNGLAWLGLFASVAAVLTALLVLSVVVTHAAALALTSKVGVLRALKGEIPARAALVATYLIRVPALLLALAVAMDVVLSGQNVLARQDSQDTYARAGDAVTIRLNGSLVGEQEQIIREVGRWLRRSDASGEVIVVGRRDLQDVSSDARLPQGELLVVNETYLDEQPVLDPAGQRYSATARSGRRTDTATVRLIVPESMAHHTADIRSGIPDLLGRLSPATRRNLKVTASRAKDGQRLFGYNPGNLSPNMAHSPEDDRSLVRDPVLVVVPNGSELLTDDTYTAFASQEGIVFPDPDHVLNAITSDKDVLQTYVTSVRPVGQNAALKLREAVNDFRLQLFDLLAVVAVLLITGVGVCVIHTRRRSQTIFARHLSGWRFTANHRFILSSEAVVAVFLACWVPVRVWQQNQELEEFTSRGIPAPYPEVRTTGWDAAAIGGLVAVEVCAVLLALWVFHRRIVKERAADL
ncbi:bacteriocin-associated integral membrane family protein [Streptomyces scabiei]|uniref:bacteriocin-associated integral membrane family protein n=1 Tax=Streptomyces scabiei TaxID=1930 RepID=UPI0036E56549